MLLAIWQAPVDAPLPTGLLTTNIGLPIVVVCCKADVMQVPLYHLAQPCCYLMCVADSRARREGRKCYRSAVRFHPAAVTVFLFEMWGVLFMCIIGTWSSSTLSLILFLVCLCWCFLFWSTRRGSFGVHGSNEWVELRSSAKISFAPLVSCAFSIQSEITGEVVFSACLCLSSFQMIGPFTKLLNQQFS